MTLLFLFKSVRTATATVCGGGSIDTLSLTRKAWQELLKDGTFNEELHTEIESNAKAYRQSTEERRKSRSSDADMNAEEEEVHVIADY